MAICKGHPISNFYIYGLKLIRPLRCILAILILYSFFAFPQNAQWVELKQSIKKESDKSKILIRDWQQKKNLPISFSDGRNHFLMRAVHPSGKPIYLTTLNAGAAQTSGASKIQNGSAGFSLNGLNHHIFQWDAGLVDRHIELTNRVVANEGANADNHATHVAGILMASGVNLVAKGMAPNANLHAYYFDDDISEMAAQAESNPYGFMISNHSYGTSTGWNKANNAWTWHGDELVSNEEDYTAGFYSARTRQIDQLALLAPYYTIVWAAGNDRGDGGTGGHPPDCNAGSGFDCIIQEGAAKNIITVGAVNKVLTYGGSPSVGMSTFSSWGPTDDGRIKPDLVGAGVGLFSSAAGGTDGYATLSGTSMATPNVAGSLLLLQELYGKLNGGQWMKASTLKALAIHTAKEAGPGPGPDYSFGWGLIDAAQGARLISQRDEENVFIAERNLLNNETHQWHLMPQLNKKITVTLVWHDPAGVSPGASVDPPHSMLINDLDIRLVDANGAQKFPWILNPGSPASAATRGNNIRDNVEKLEFDLPEAKPYSLVVSHKGYLVNGHQPYSLIISYTAQTSSNYFYWIGGTGDWNDPQHWALASGAASAGVVPAQKDKVIVDENSFPDSGIIRLSANAKCQSLRWWTTKNVSLDFNGHKLEIGKELTLASPSFRKIGHGKFALNSLDSGTVYGTLGIIQKPDIEIRSGKWKVGGNVLVDSLIISGGSVELKEADLSVDHFTALSTGTKLLAINSFIKVNKAWQTDASKIEIVSNGSSIKIESDTVSFQSKDLNWQGHISISNAKVDFMGTIILDSISIRSASTVSMASGSTITLNKGFDAEGSVGKLISLSSAGSASIQLNFHRKICLDFLTISHVNLSGNGIVGIGKNSSVNNATGWIEQNCDDLVFPDFVVQYNCVNSMTEFLNTSTGPIETFQWDFGDAASAQNTSNLGRPVHQFSKEGNFTISLSVSGKGKTNKYSKTITILPNTLPETHIEYNSEIMFSSTEAKRYQWMENGALLPNETKRIYAYQGAEGLYQVVVFDNQCNSTSSPLLIAEVTETNRAGLNIYPVPASDKIFFNKRGVVTLSIKDFLGRSFMIPWESESMWADISSLHPGLYLLILEKDGTREATRFVVER